MDFGVKQQGHNCLNFIKLHGDEVVEVIKDGITYRVEKYICRSCGRLLFRDVETRERINFKGGLGREMDASIT